MERIIGLILLVIGWYRLTHGKPGLILSGVGAGLLLH